MNRRGLRLGSYYTAAEGWTLSAFKLGAAPQKTNRVTKPTGDGSWDFSTALTDGRMAYGDRTLTARLERSDGTRLLREEKIRELINLLDGERVRIEVPDDCTHYLQGRLSITREFSDMAHCAVSISAVCEPWKYSTHEVVRRLAATTTTPIVEGSSTSGTIKTVELFNSGRRVVVPSIYVADTARLEFKSEKLFCTGSNAGPVSFSWETLSLQPGVNTLKYASNGEVRITYREAVLE